MSIFRLLGVVLLLAVVSAAQNGSTPSSKTPQATASGAGPQSDADLLIRSNARLVLVDVVVSDRNNEPISGLTASDFTLLEDGKPQRIRFFDPHKPAAPTDAARVSVPVPPHVYTNVLNQSADAVPTIILFDKLNTPFIDQAYAREQTLRFLKTLPKGQSVALFTLGTELRMVQGFSGTSDALIAAAEKLLPKNSPLLSTESDRQSDADLLARIESAMGNGSGHEVVGSIRASQAEQEAFYTDMRVGRTLDALDALARAVSGYAGRKNLLWLSAGFPFVLGPDFTLPNQMRNMRDYGPMIRETASRFASERIAVYPIDATGLSGGGIVASSDGFAVMNSPLDGGRAYGSLLDRQGQQAFSTRLAMNDLAEQTGGRALYNTNDLQNAMRRGLEHGSSYYTLAYVPENRVWNGSFRHIKVKLEREARMEYRRGYFAVANQAPLTEKELKKKLVIAVQPSIPDSTMLSLVVQVLPPEKPGAPVSIDYILDPRQIAFTENAQARKHAVVDFFSVAWDKDNRDAGHASDTVEAALLPDTYAKLLQSGFRKHQELTLKPGVYHLRIGVMDRTTQNIGTIDVPLTVSGT